MNPAFLWIIGLTAWVGLSLLHRSVWCGLVNVLVAFAFWAAIWFTVIAFRA